MGCWSRAAGTAFLGWFAPSRNASWLDVGCGTGAFTELVLDTCAPGSVVAVDPVGSQLDYARQRHVAGRASFRVADAQALPFPDRSFDVVASALVINFVPERLRALSEMRRVARPNGAVGGYVWDFKGERSPTEPLTIAIRQMGIEVPRISGTEDSSLEALRRLFERTGFDSIAVKMFEVTMSFIDFESYWRRQTPAFNPQAKIVATLSKRDRRRLKDTLQDLLKPRSDGSIVCSARANAIKACIPM